MSARSNPAAGLCRMRSGRAAHAPPARSSWIGRARVRRSRAAMAAGVAASADSTSSRAPGCRSGATGATGRPQTDTLRPPRAQPSRARASAKAEGAGWHTVSAAGTRAASTPPIPKQYGSPEASTATGSPAAGRGWRGTRRPSGLGQASRSPRDRRGRPAPGAAGRRPPTRRPRHGGAGGGGQVPVLADADDGEPGRGHATTAHARADPGRDDGGLGDRAGAGGRCAVRARAVACRPHPRAGAAADPVARRRLRRRGGPGGLRAPRADRRR